jgi:hypothetical protein
MGGFASGGASRCEQLHCNHLAGIAAATPLRSLTGGADRLRPKVLLVFQQVGDAAFATICKKIRCRRSI